MKHDTPASSAGLLAASSAFGWPGLSVQTRRHPGGEFRFDPFDNHLLSLHLGNPIFLERSQGGGHLKQEQMTCGTAVLIPAGQASFWRHTDATHYLNLHLSRALLEQTAVQVGSGDSGDLAGFDPAAFQDSQVAQITLLLQTEMGSGALYGRLYAEMLASALCVRLLHREHGRRRQSPPPAASAVRSELRQALSYIQDNLTTDLSLASLAREAGLSACYLARLFTEAFGVPPHQYIIQTRIERAKALMTQGGLSPGDAARLTGFADQSHFTRHFKRLMGVTPGAFTQKRIHWIVP